MTYTTVDELKSYLGLGTVGDDDLLETLIAAAQSTIERKTHVVFEASGDTTRYYTVGKRTYGLLLMFDCYFCALTTVKTNADAPGGGDTIPSNQYITLPRNKAPYYGIEILPSSDYRWEYTNNPETGIAITGKAAYSATAPDDIKQACKRLAAYYYRQKDAGIYDVTAIPDAGIIQIPQGMPADVSLILEPYIIRTEF